MYRKIKILFIAQDILKKELGGPKVVIELAEAINRIGHFATVVGPKEIERFLLQNFIPIEKTYASNINKYLQVVAENYDIIDVDANYLYDYQTIKGKGGPLIVTRSVLFIPHLQIIKWPQVKTYKNKIGEFIRKMRYGNLQELKIIRFYQSLKKADLINVSNHKDVEMLLSDGFPRDNIIQIPYGLSDAKRKSLNKLANLPKKGNKIAFIGTFDFRKGCLDIVKIFTEIKKQIPDAELSLLGTKGLFQTRKKVFSFFPKSLRNSVTVIPEFQESDLPELLKEFKVGLFPSYLEGFGFSVIELFSAGIPVIAYDAPGPSSILSDQFLVPPGDWISMAKKLIFYLKNDNERKQVQNYFIQSSGRYDWKDIAKATVEEYIKKLESRNNMILQSDLATKAL